MTAFYYRAGVLERLVRAINKWRPKRDKRTDGWIGDTAHKKRKSDHNPDPTSKPPGVVRAQDIDTDGIHVPTLLAALFVHPSTHYVIHQKTIWTSENRFRPAHYTGTPHVGHVHESVMHGRENGNTLWALIETVPSWGGGVRLGVVGRAAHECQAYLNAYGATLVLDGDFGPASDKALRAFQSKHKLKVDGIAGPRTIATFRTA